MLLENNGSGIGTVRPFDGRDQGGARNARRFDPLRPLVIAFTLIALLAVVVLILLASLPNKYRQPLRKRHIT